MDQAAVKPETAVKVVPLLVVWKSPCTDRSVIAWTLLAFGGTYSICGHPDIA